MNSSWATFETESFWSEIFVLRIMIHSPKLDIPIIRTGQKVVLIYLKDVLDSTLVSIHLSNCLFLNIYQAQLAIWFSIEKYLGVIFSLLPENWNSIRRKVKRVWLFRLHWDSGPDIYTSSSSSSKKIVVIPDNFFNILERFIYNLWIEHKCLLFWSNNR